MIAPKTSALLVLALAQSALSLVASYPEVHPGKGLPSLASLGLTSAQLHKMGLPSYSSGPIQRPGLQLKSKRQQQTTSSVVQPASSSSAVSVAPPAQSSTAPAAGCGPTGADYTDVNDLITCFHYLNGLGSQVCTVQANTPSQFCYTGKGQIIGQSYSSNGTSSLCTDVASAVLDAINGCTRPDQTCAGEYYAHGNGFLLVESKVLNL